MRRVVTAAAAIFLAIGIGISILPRPFPKPDRDPAQPDWIAQIIKGDDQSRTRNAGEDKLRPIKPGHAPAATTTSRNTESPHGGVANGDYELPLVDGTLVLNANGSTARSPEGESPPAAADLVGIAFFGKGNRPLLRGFALPKSDGGMWVVKIGFERGILEETRALDCEFYSVRIIQPEALTVADLEALDRTICNGKSVEAWSDWFSRVRGQLDPTVNLHLSKLLGAPTP